MRNDLPSMGFGRAAAQSSHASNALTVKFGLRDDVYQWQMQTKQGFGTAIVLSVDKQTMCNIDCDDLIVKLPHGIVTDPDYVIKVNKEVASLLLQNYDARFCNFKMDYTFENEGFVLVSRSEPTCGYVLGTKEYLEPLLGKLPLYGN